MSRDQAKSRAMELLEMVGIPDSDSRFKSYPHQLSGGQRQRAMIAMALSCNANVLIADEATTALDVTIQAQILELIMELSKEFRTATILITHNLGVIARYADRVNVMYAGRIRESGSADDLFYEPHHPYTIGLLRSVPHADEPPGKRLESIEGELTDLLDLPAGCAFRPRCPSATDQCAIHDPPLTETGAHHLSACWHTGLLVQKTKNNNV